MEDYTVEILLGGINYDKKEQKAFLCDGKFDEISVLRLDL